MEMAAQRAILRVAAIAMLMQLAAATTYTVGGPQGSWSVETNLQVWANSNTFYVGDTITFTYQEGIDVVVVSKQDYDTCQTTNATQIYATGNTTISLNYSGEIYFICGVPGLCAAGLKVAIFVHASSSSPQPSPSAPPHTSPSTPPSPSKGIAAPTHSLVPPSVSPSKSPVSSSASAPTAVAIGSPTIAPSPSGSLTSSQPSSADNISGLAGFTMGLGFTIMMLLSSL